MRLRTLVLSGVLASGLSLSLVPRVAADPPPWAGARGHDDANHNHRWHRNGDHNVYGRGGNHRRNDPAYSRLADRIHNDRAKIAEIGPTGRHRKALQWYRDDLRNAERDMHNLPRS